MCQTSGLPPISTSGLGRMSVSSESLVPRPPARIATFMSADTCGCSGAVSGREISHDDAGAYHRRVSARRALITGVGGQDGALLAQLLLGRGYHLAGIVRRD